MVLWDVSHAGAVHPLGFLPVNLVSTSIDLVRTSLSCSSLSVETNSCVYPWRPLSKIYNLDKQRDPEAFSATVVRSYISWPASRILAICSGKDSTECAGMNHVVLMLYFSHNFNRRSTPTVAPKMPRETSVQPPLLFILHLLLAYLRSAYRKAIV